MNFKVDVNCDLGESYGRFKVGNDAEIMPHITSANIACGFHAGDPATMMRTVALAKKHNVAVGAHPGYPDLMGFGRRIMKLTSEEAKSYIIYQVGALEGFAAAAGLKLQHVKPHGAMYNVAVKDEELSKAIVEAVAELNSNLIIFAPPSSMLAETAAKTGLKVAHEFFADRAYNPDGTLVSRSQPNATIEDREKVVNRAVQAVKEGTVKAFNGELVNLGEIHTICVHGDTPSAVNLATALKKGLLEAGVQVEKVGEFL